MSLRAIACHRGIGCVAAALVAGACAGGPPADDGGAPDLVVTIDRVEAVDPGDRLGPSSRLVLVDTDGGVRPFGPEGRSVGNATVSWTGERVLAAVRETGDGPVRIWSLPLAGSGAKALDLGRSLDCGSADELPDGRIVLSARTAEPAPTPELGSGWALWVHDPEDGTTRRITYGLGEIDPSVLSDGRIVYSGWQPGGDGRGDGGVLALFTVHPDGTGVAPFHGHHGELRWALRSRELATGNVVVFAGTAPDDLRPVRIDRRDPAAPAQEFRGPRGEALRGVARGGGVDVALGRDGRVVDSAGHGAYPGLPPEAADAIPAVRRPRPQGHLSMIDPNGDRGVIFLVDGRPAGVESVATTLRVRAAVPGEAAAELGRLELAADGSAFFEVPANERLWIDVLDAAGAPVEVSRTPIWVRPNEKRGCVGCHEGPTVAPPNRRPEAVLRDPVDLAGGRS